VLAAAARAVAAVAFDGRTLDDALDRQITEPALRPAVRAVAFGTVRWYLRLQFISGLLVEGRALAPLLRTLLAVALHQLDFSRNPPPATVSAAVDAARRLAQPRATGLLNALLRRYLREQELIRARLPAEGEAQTAHPQWLIDALRSAYPEHWRAIVTADNAHPPLTLRLDRSRIESSSYLEALRGQGLGGRAVPWMPSAVVLDAPVPVMRLPGFDAGWVSVQDAGAQLAAVLLGVRPGERVLDACAAPGGKTGALLEAVDGDLELTALDVDEARLDRVRQNLDRLKRPARLVRADLRAEPDWWDGRPFDRILLDAPCSGTGVIRRHPDIRLLRRASDAEGFAETQRALLERCLMLLRDDGRLLYSTCSVLRAENASVLESVLAAHPGARTVPLQLPERLPRAVIEPCGVQLLPDDQAPSDGFYYACLTVSRTQQRRLA
jgi:16S rRNA (cytosine967-C5)-methyltransferase